MSEQLNETKKYYWVWIECQRMTYPFAGHAYESILDEQALIEVHPLAYVAECNEQYAQYMQGKDKINEVYKLRNWKEITEEEYNLYKDNF